MIAMYPPTAYPPGEPCPRCAEYERRLDELQTMYDRIAAELIEALDRASAYRVTAARQQEWIEKRLGGDRRKFVPGDRYEIFHSGRRVNDRRKS